MRKEREAESISCTNFELIFAAKEPLVRPDGSRSSANIYGDNYLTSEILMTTAIRLMADSTDSRTYRWSSASAS